MKNISFTILIIFLIGFNLFVAYKYDLIDNTVLKCNQEVCINPIAQCQEAKGTTNFYYMNCENLKYYNKYCSENEHPICSVTMLKNSEQIGEKPYLIKYGVLIMIVISSFIWLIDKLIFRD